MELLSMETPIKEVRSKQQMNAQAREAAAALDMLAQILPKATARQLITIHPACIAHATALVAEVTKPHVKNQPALLRRLIETDWTPPAPPVRLAPEQDRTCPASTRDDPHTLDQCHGMHGWPALHAITGTPCVSDPDDRFHSRCYAQLRALIADDSDHAA